VSVPAKQQVEIEMVADTFAFGEVMGRPRN